MEKINSIKKKMDISFIIVNWNTKQLTVNAIKSIIATCADGLEYEVIVVDNNSSDGSMEYITNMFHDFSNLIVHKMSSNIGYGPAHNEGYSLSKGEWVFFLNSDVIFLENCIINLLDVASKNKMAGLYSPQILNEDLSHQDVTSYLMPYTYQLLFKRITEKKRLIEQNHDVQGVEVVAMIHGVAYLLHRNFIEKYGAWAKDLTMYSEDWDFCFRIYKNKKKCFMVKDAKLIHLSESSSTKKWSGVDKNKIIEISRSHFAKKYSEFGCYEFYWLYSLLKSFYRGYVRGNRPHKDMVIAKLWLIKTRLFGDLEKEERILLK